MRGTWDMAETWDMKDTGHAGSGRDVEGTRETEEMWDVGQDMGYGGGHGRDIGHERGPGM